MLYRRFTDVAAEDLCCPSGRVKTAEDAAAAAWGCHVVYQMDGAIAVLYCKKKNVLVCPPTPRHIPMEFIHVVEHTCIECDDDSLIVMLSFSVFVDHIKNNS